MLRRILCNHSSKTERNKIILCILNPPFKFPNYIVGRINAHFTHQADVTTEIMKEICKTRCNPLIGYLHRWNMHLAPAVLLDGGERCNLVLILFQLYARRSPFTSSFALFPHGRSVE